MAGWFDVGQEARGVIAIGQIATGVIAIGQMATGVIAIGQVARGFVAVGQGAIGLIAVGMGAVGLFHATAMMGIAARGIGFVLPVAPFWPRRYPVPETAQLADLTGGRADDGWLEVELGSDEHGPRLLHAGAPLDVRFDRATWARAVHAVDDVLAPSEPRLYAHLQVVGDELLCTGLLRRPRRAHRARRYWVMLPLQFAALVGVAVAVGLVAGLPVIDAIVEF